MDALHTTAATWGLTLTDAQLAQFARYSVELQRWNERVNLTAITDERTIVVRHFLDSLAIARSWGQEPDTLIDIGAGAGFPGVPLKILRPHLRLTLVESVAKKAEFLRQLSATLGLTDVTIIVARAEQIGRDPAHREQYAIVTARAVADLAVLAEYCLPLCRVGGRMLAPKGADCADEITQARAAIDRLGGTIAGTETIHLPDTEPRTLVIIDKIAATPAAYPRAVGIPAKRPLR